MLGSCSSSREASISDINGTWDIVKIDGAKTSGNPYIGFNTVAGQVYGNSGCNNILGSFDTGAPAGTLSLDKLGSTRMMCPDMSGENAVLAALSKVRGFKKDGDGLALLDSAGNTAAQLRMRCKPMKPGKLDGQWLITKINGQPIPGGLQTTPTLTFDAEKQRVSGNGGCNIINGSYKTDGESIEFSQMISTMMACQDMDTEAALLEALSLASKFGTTSDGKLGLFDDNDRLLIELVSQ